MHRARSRGTGMLEADLGNVDTVLHTLRPRWCRRALTNATDAVHCEQTYRC